jgi:hypothetical protein
MDPTISVEVVEYSKTGLLLSILLDLLSVIWFSYSTHVLSEPIVSVEVVEYSKTGLLLSSLLDLYPMF